MISKYWNTGWLKKVRRWLCEDAIYGPLTESKTSGAELDLEERTADN